METSKSKLFGKFALQTIIGYLAFLAIDQLVKQFVPYFVHIKNVVVETANFSPTKNMWLILITVLYLVVMVMIYLHYRKVCYTERHKGEVVHIPGWFASWPWMLCGMITSEFLWIVSLMVFPDILAKQPNFQQKAGLVTGGLIIAPLFGMFLGGMIVFEIFQGVYKHIYRQWPYPPEYLDMSF